MIFNMLAGQNQGLSTNPFRPSPTQSFFSVPDGGFINGDMPALAFSLPKMQELNFISPFSLPNQSLIPERNPEEFKKGGKNGMKRPMGGLSQMIPAGFTLNSFNNSPSNVPGGPGGGFQFSSLIQSPTFTIPKTQPFITPTHDTQLVHPQLRFPKGGKTFFGKIFRGIGNAFTDVIGGLGEGIQKVAPIASIFAPGLGQVAGTIGGQLGRLNDKRQAQGLGRFGTGLGNVLGGGAFGTGAGNSQFQSSQSNILGQLPFGSQFADPFSQLNNPFGATPGFTGFNDFSSLFGNIGRFGGPNVLNPGIPGITPSFRQGGQIPASDLIPIQAEQVGKLPEKIVHLDGSITDVNARTRHKFMDDDEITDLIPSGSYILSADKGMKISRNQLDKITMGWEVTPYSENKRGDSPKELVFSDILPKGKKEFTPAELGDIIRKKWKIVDYDVMDIFTQNTNEENLISRLPYVTATISLNEDKKGIDTFAQGGSIPKAPQGGQFLSTLGDIGTVAATALPLLSSLFGSGNSGSGQGLDPFTNILLQGSIPLNTAGTISNVRAQQNALGRAQGNLTNLTSDLQALNNQATGLGAGAFASLETDAPLLNFDTSRLEGFRTQTPRSFVNALSTPNFDINSIIGQLGRGSAPVISNLISSQNRLANEAAISQFNQDRSLEFEIANRLTNIGIDQDIRNQGIQTSNIANRNNQILGVTGQLQTGLGQQGNILSNAFTAGTQFDLQRAGLSGQISKQLAQDSLNLAAIRQTLLNNRQNNQSAPVQSGFSSPGIGGFTPNLPSFGGSSTTSSTSSLPILDGLQGLRFPTTNNLPILNGLEGLGFGSNNSGPLGIPITIN